MNSGLGVNSPAVVAAFHAALRHQGLAVLLVAALVVSAWNAWRLVVGRPIPGPVQPGPEAPARRLLRLGFGWLWVLDGLLQLQQSMPLGLVPDVIQPAASTSPGWVQHLVAAGATVWSDHPVTAAAATVWVQTGIGVWLLLARRGTLSRLAGVVSVAWAVPVWVLGEAFGGVFGTGASWLTGAPGAVMLYAAAGVAVALPEEWWRSPRLGRVWVRMAGTYLLGMALLQAWPGRGQWRGQPAGSPIPGSLTSAVQSAGQTPQPAVTESAVTWFAHLDAAHGWAVNLVVVVALAALGAGLLTARRVPVLAASAGSAVMCLTAWLLVQDLGVFGGVGTDPNSMVPTLLLVVAGAVALRHPGAAPAQAVVGVATRPWWQRTSSAGALRTIASAGAVVVLLIGAVPLTADAAERRAEPVITTAVDGPPEAISAPATPWSLIDSAGRPASLAGLRGRVVALTFLDDTCTADCPVIAQEFKQAEGLLGTDASNVTFVAINANPEYLAPAYLAAFDTSEGMARVPHWEYLTGTLGQLRALWKAYGVYVAPTPGGGMIDHNDVSYVIGPNGRLRYELDAAPGPGTGATQSSFAVTLDGAIRSVQAHP